MKANTRWAAMAVPLSLLYLPQASADPFDDTNVMDEASYSSPFDGYVKDEDMEMGGWVRANERVAEIGGWRTYLKEAQEPMAAPETSGKQQTDMPHGGHGANHSSQHGAK